MKRIVRTARRLSALGDMTSDDIKEWAKLIRKVAYQTSRDFPYTEVDDLIQEMWCALLDLQQRGKMQHWTEMHAEQTLRYAAHLAAWKARREHLTISPQYGYRTSDVRKLFDHYFTPESWLDGHVPDDAKSELGPVQLEMMGDVSRAYSRLDDSYKVLLFRWHVLKDDFEPSEKKKLSRGYARIADILNTYHPSSHAGPGARKAISNARANAIRDDYETKS